MTEILGRRMNNLRFGKVRRYGATWRRSVEIVGVLPTPHDPGAADTPNAMTV
jgi:hypothetical protein